MITMFSYGAVYARKREQYMVWVSSYSMTRQKNLVNTEFISERLLKISIREGNKINHYIQMYAPCNDSYSDEDKDSFEKLSDTINNIKEQDDLYVMGDFNGRVGVRRTPWTKHLGPHSDHRTPCNYNGNHILELCAEHDLIMYQHILPA